MLNYFSGFFPVKHQYSLVLLFDDGKEVSKVFASRDAANETMYEIIGKRGLAVKKIYNDKHEKTYICTNGAEFHINRVI